MIEIKGSDKLEQIVGFPSSFHDAEILSIVLDRDIPSSTFTLLASEYDATQHVCSFEVVLRFFDIEKVHLESFNHQNIVSSLHFEEMFEETEYSSEIIRRIHVTLDTVFGAWSTLTCADVEVVSVRASSRKTGDPKYNRPTLRSG